MFKIFDRTVVFMTLALLCPVAADETSKSPDFVDLSTKNGQTYRQCFVTRVEPDALLIRHEGGVARISLFDLSPEIQARYKFDPIEGLKFYQKNLEQNRERRKTLLLETEKNRARAAKIQADREILLLAKTEWIPVEARVLQITEDGAWIRAKRITMVPTQVRSTLGFLNDGPPRRELKDFAPGNLILRNPSPTLKIGDLWKGYLNPVPRSFVIDPESGLPTVPAHDGAPLEGTTP